MSQPSQPFRRITVTVRRDHYATWLPFTTGVVLVDSRRVGFLIGGRTRTFHVAPGEHTIGVDFMAFGPSFVATEPLKLEEGDRVDLVGGRMTPSRPSKALVKALLLGLSYFLTVEVIFPNLSTLRDSLVSILIGLDLGAPWSGWLSQLLRMATTGVAVYVFLALWTWVLMSRGREPTAPCYLRRNHGKKKILVGDL